MFQFYRRAYPAPNRSEADLLHNLTLEELEEWPLNYARNANKSTPVASAITTRKVNAPRRLASMGLHNRVKNHLKMKRIEVHYDPENAERLSGLVASIQSAGGLHRNRRIYEDRSGQ